MPVFPGFPSNDFDFHFEEAGGALAGLLMRDRAGEVVPGVLPHRETLLSAGPGWSIDVAAFVAARSKGRAVLLGGSTVDLSVDVQPAPGTNSRIDVIYTLPADVGAGDLVEAVAVVTGVPGAVPGKPSIPLGALELGTFRTQAGQGSAAQGLLTETSPFAALTGAVLLARTKAALDVVDAMDGTQARVLATGQSYERKGSEWLGGAEFPFVTPFQAYSAGGVVSVEVEGGMVTVSGIATTSQPTQLVGNTNRTFAQIGSKYGPRRSIVQVMQGSGASRWSLTVSPEGQVSAARYGPSDPISGVWLPFQVSYPVKR